MIATPALVTALDDFRALRELALSYRARQTEVTLEIRATFDRGWQLRRLFRELGCHGHELAVQLLLMLASEQDQAMRDVLGEAADRLVDLDRRHLDREARP